MFPLKRINFSNEKLQAYLFVALVVNLIVGFREQLYNPANFIIILTVTLLIDTVFNFIRYKKILCSVSSGITVAVVVFMLPGVSLPLLLLASAVTITMGKQIWGGTGKNPVNPALLGVLLISSITTVDEPQVGFLILLCLPFIFLRLIPAVAFIFSSYVVYLITGNWSWITLLIAFVAVTDPVTIKDGLFSGVLIFVLNSIILYFFNNPVLSLLIINILEFSINKVKPELFNYRYRPLRIKQLFKLSNNPKLSFSFDQSIDIKSDLNLIEVLEKNPINGQGGASFPLLYKIKGLKGDNKTLIVNGAECDPGLFHDKYLMDNLGNVLAKTALYLKEKLEIDRTFIASKQEREFKNIKHVKLKNYFPVGYEKTVIKEVTGEIIPEDKHPTDLGYLIINVQTLLQLYLVLTNQKNNDRFISLCDLNNNKATVIKVQNGVTIGSVLDESKIKTNKIFIGGGLMAATPGDRDVVISDSINSIFYGKQDYFKESPQCSLCGFCIKVCPVGINPSLEVKNDKCIKCGACSYVCLAGRKLSTRIY